MKIKCLLWWDILHIFRTCKSLEPRAGNSRRAVADSHSPSLGRAVLESPPAENGAGVLESGMFFWIREEDVVDSRYPLAHHFKYYPQPPTPTPLGGNVWENNSSSKRCSVRRADVKLRKEGGEENNNKQKAKNDLSSTY